MSLLSRYADSRFSDSVTLRSVRHADDTTPGDGPAAGGGARDGNGHGNGPDQPAGGDQTAGLGARFLALLVDWLLCLMLAGLIARPPATGLWVYPFLFVEYAIFVGSYTQTPGMRLAKVRCVSATEGGPIGAGRAFVRTVLMALVVPVLIMDSYGRGLHDKAVNSVMLAVPRPPTK